CHICGLPFKTRGNLNIHKNTHSQSRFRCNLCSSIFAQESGLKQHVKIIHRSDDESHICDLCGKCFPVQVYLKTHKRRVHEKTLACNYCAKVFPVSSSLRKHYKTCQKMKQ